MLNQHFLPFFLVFKIVQRLNRSKYPWQTIYGRKVCGKTFQFHYYLIKYFEVERCDVMSKMAEICFIAAKIGCYTNLRVRILTNQTIFCNFSTRQIRWNTSFNDLQTLKISFCKGPPLQIWLIMTSSRCGKTRQSNFLVLPKIESQDLKDHFKKGFSHAYFQKSKTSF